MFCAMIVSACADRVPGWLGRHRALSSPRARRAARSVDVRDDELEDAVAGSIGSMRSSPAMGIVYFEGRSLPIRMRADGPGRCTAPNAIRSASTRSRPTPTTGSRRSAPLENFPISGLRAPAELVTATDPHQESRRRGQRGPRPSRAGRRPRHRRRPPTRCSPGDFRDQFVVDVYQAGAGTSHNMNANEVLANRAAEILGEPRGTYTRVHPNDHVNMGQSTNDVFPTATRLALLLGHARRSSQAARALADVVRAKGARVRGRAEGRPHAPAGRRADDARPGVRRLRRAASRAAPTTWTQASSQLARAEPRRHRGRHGLNAGAEYAQERDRPLCAATRACRSTPPRTCFA